MNNIVLVETAKMLNNINDECYTYGVWKDRGYQVKKGEKARFSEVIWKAKTYTDENGTENKKFFMKKSHFFTSDQVEKIKK